MIKASTLVEPFAYEVRGQGFRDQRICGEVSRTVAQQQGKIIKEEIVCDSVLYSRRFQT